MPTALIAGPHGGSLQMRLGTALSCLSPPVPQAASACEAPQRRPPCLALSLQAARSHSLSTAATALVVSAGAAAAVASRPLSPPPLTVRTSSMPRARPALVSQAESARMSLCAVAAQRQPIAVGSTVVRPGALLARSPLRPASLALSVARPAPPTTPAEVMRRTALGVGKEVQVEGMHFRMKELLSQGSFGDVWVAVRIGEHRGAAALEAASWRPGVVIKEIFCQHRAAVASAEFEGEVLRRCGGFGAAVAGPGDHAMGCRIPALLAKDTTTVGEDLWRVRLAMARIPGEALDEFLERRRQAATAAAASSGGASAVAAGFDEALVFAQALLLQLASAMELVSDHAFHRDVHPRNMLIEERPAGLAPCLGLVDFGLAVDAGRWRQGGWRERGAAGDCRYWPPSAWLYFADGEEEVLDERPRLRAEYEERLDLHSVALTALEVFVKISPSPSSGSRGESDRGSGNTLREFCDLIAAWEEYWQEASRHWSAVFGAYSEGGDVSALKSSLLELGVHTIIQQKLVKLRHASQEAALALRRANSSREGAAFFELVAAMLGCGEDAGAPAPTWAEVLRALDSCQDEGPVSTPRRPWLPSGPPTALNCKAGAPGRGAEANLREALAAAAAAAAAVRGPFEELSPTRLRWPRLASPEGSRAVPQSPLRFGRPPAASVITPLAAASPVSAVFASPARSVQSPVAAAVSSPAAFAFGRVAVPALSARLSPPRAVGLSPPRAFVVGSPVAVAVPTASLSPRSSLFALPACSSPRAASPFAALPIGASPVAATAAAAAAALSPRQRLAAPPMALRAVSAAFSASPRAAYPQVAVRRTLGACSAAAASQYAAPVPLFQAASITSRPGCLSPPVLQARPLGTAVPLLPATAVAASSWKWPAPPSAQPALEGEAQSSGGISPAAPSFGSFFYGGTQGGFSNFPVVSRSVLAAPAVLGTA